MSCPCTERHDGRRIVLTGGPGGGKTAVLELVRHTFCSHVHVLPEAASIVFGGGFPRGAQSAVRRAGQRAIFHVQHELEATQEGSNAAVLLCDRGTIDGVAYWPGPEDFWSSLGTTLEEQLARYDAVIHLRVPPDGNGYNHANPLRIESAAEAVAIDARIADAWRGHPNVIVVDPTPQFLTKASRVLHVLRELMPACCRPFVKPLDGANGFAATHASHLA
jgi:predicted ATPase